MDQEKDDNMESLLIEQIKNGDDRAFSQLVDRWYQKIYRYALRFTGKKSMAEEVVQKTFIQVHKHLHNLEDIQKFKPWVYRIASNICISEGRREQSKNKYIISTAELPDTMGTKTPVSLYEKAERSAFVKMALGQLPSEQRQVILMKEWEGLKFREIAESLGESESTVKSRLYYGLTSLRKILNKYQWTKELYDG